MSDYFGSLMRASGLDANGTAPTPTPAVNMADSAPSLLPSPSDSLEIESTARRIESTPPQTERAVREPPQHQSPAIHQDTPAPFARPDAEPHTDRASQSATSTALEPPSALDPHVAPSSQSLLRSALRWIAADPEAPHRKTDSIRTKPSESHELHRAPVQHTDVTERSSRASDALASTQTIEAVVPTKTDRPYRAEAATPALDHAQLTVLPDRVSPARAAPLHDADDSAAFDVSIGSIHVRVDAPMPQTVARPAPAPSHTRAAPAPSRQRSSLARRALRRL